jgi:hypothetical protein
MAGERIGVSGIGNHVAHLHLGLLLDGKVLQDSWEWILRDDAIRKLFRRCARAQVSRFQAFPASP